MNLPRSINNSGNDEEMDHCIMEKYQVQAGTSNLFIEQFLESNQFAQ